MMINEQADESKASEYTHWKFIVDRLEIMEGRKIGLMWFLLGTLPSRRGWCLNRTGRLGKGAGWDRMGEEMKGR